MTIFAYILMFAGVFFLAVSAIGVIRLPDFYSRIHAVGKSETLGAMLLLGGLAVYNGWSVITLKILLIIVFVMIANPTAAHLLGRAALQSRIKLWTRTGKVSINKSNNTVAEQQVNEQRMQGNKGGDTKE